MARGARQRRGDGDGSTRAGARSARTGRAFALVAREHTDSRCRSSRCMYTRCTTRRNGSRPRCPRSECRPCMPTHRSCTSCVSEKRRLDLVGFMVSEKRRLDWGGFMAVSVYRQGRAVVATHYVHHPGQSIVCCAGCEHDGHRNRFDHFHVGTVRLGWSSSHTNGVGVRAFRFHVGTQSCSTTKPAPGCRAGPVRAVGCRRSHAKAHLFRVLIEVIALPAFVSGGHTGHCSTI
jgi:hypothetical protein